ncbi:hypothetical protein E2C01_011237 [Portunus trituberculatus]|uniref:Uncharacterized protein n=1 Tax=Portunus trituberculatus TaxID=210409 RepID=A0A5B7DAJ4_PORTR|nr:hypothetical protein [Portunus trituberculatus]
MCFKVFRLPVKICAKSEYAKHSGLAAFFRGVIFKIIYVNVNKSTGLGRDVISSPGQTVTSRWREAPGCLPLLDLFVHM